MAEDLRKYALPGLLALVGLLFIGGFVIWGSFIRNAISPSAAASTSQTFDPAVTATTSGFLNDVQILYSDTFNETSVTQWNVNVGTIENGVMELIGNQDWNFSYWNGNLGVNEGVVLEFNYSDFSLSEIFLEYGTWNTDTYKRFGVYIGGDQAKLNGYRGKEDGDYGGANLSGNLTLQPDTTYALLIAVLPNGEFLEVIWDPSNPAETLSHRERIDETWDGLTWTLWIGVNQGTIKIDEFSKISFSGAK